MLKLIFSLLISFSLLGQTQQIHSFDFKSAEKNLSVLTADSLEGRECGTRGCEKAADFLSEKLSEYGLIPLTDSTSFFNSFTLEAERIDTASTMTFSTDSSNILFNFPDDFVFDGRLIQHNPAVRELVFAGYGIEKKDKGLNPYGDIDAKGKYVVLLNGSPAVYSSSTDEQDINSLLIFHKLLSAGANGAKGVIIVLPEKDSAEWNDYREWSSAPYALAEKLPLGSSLMPPFFFIRFSTFKQMISNNPGFIAEIRDAVRERTSIASRNISGALMINTSFSTSEISIANIVGYIPGTDSALKKEYVLISAHYDHLGRKGSSIYHGADDDASGVIGILETARRIAIDKLNKRSVIVIFHTGEEEGLWGSQEFSEHFSEMAQITAAINCEMIGREHIDSIYCIGASRLSSELKPLLEDVNDNSEHLVLDYRFDDPADPERFFYRSDHYNYAKHNIPVLFFYDHMTSDYHLPSDVAEKINLQKIQRVSNLVYQLTLRLSNLVERLPRDIE